jgi:RNA polymerase sigma factor (sigma-70 family)
MEPAELEMVDLEAETPEQRAVRFESEALPLLDPLYAGAMRLTRNPDDASDLVQETVERAFKAFHQYKPGTNFKAWMFRIQTNNYINGYRKKQRQPAQSSADDVEDWQMAKAESHTRPAYVRLKQRHSTSYLMVTLRRRWLRYPTIFDWRCTTPMSRVLRTKRSPKS